MIGNLIENLISLMITVCQGLMLILNRGGAAPVYFAVLGDYTWYTSKSVIEFEMYYDGVKYLVTTGYAKGGTDYSVIG